MFQFWLDPGVSLGFVRLIIRQFSACYGISRLYNKISESEIADIRQISASICDLYKSNLCTYIR